MPTAVFKCPTVELQVQAWFPDLPYAEDDGTHIVNTKTGQLFGDEPAED
jgi:hypothetical protein